MLLNSLSLKSIGFIITKDEELTVLEELLALAVAFAYFVNGGRSYRLSWYVSVDSCSG